jgi:CAAX protease family protein
VHDTDGGQMEPPRSNEASPAGFLIDLAIYLPVMFLVREIYFPSVDFIFNGLFWSLTTLLFATWRMRARGITWADLGLRKPEKIDTTLIATLAILGMAIGSIIVIQIVRDQLQLGVEADASSESSGQRFGDLKGNWILFFSIIPFILLESFLEELLDRGFLMNWIERMFSSTTLATVLAVVLQAMIFGFRHTYDLSERSITVGLIGLAMGIGYVAFGRNLWPLILAHCALNTMSMVERVV